MDDDKYGLEVLAITIKSFLKYLLNTDNDNKFDFGSGVGGPIDTN